MKCDICQKEYGQYANLKTHGLVMCDKCCYDPKTSEVRQLIANTLDDVHIETGRTDEFDKVVNKLLIALKPYINYGA